MPNSSKEICDSLLEALNETQRAPVLDTDGPVLVLAGAGSGKTRVLTYRIAYLIASEKSAPQNILAMTFTNKAAAEMRHRVESLLAIEAHAIWMGTFHSIFARFLRTDGEKIGLKRNFSIYDEDDQKRLLKTIINDFHMGATLSINQVRAQISNAKNALLSPELFAADARDEMAEKIAEIYGDYQIRLRANNALDFDDLLIKPITMLERFPLLLDAYQERFRYLLVDEYQDTNKAQYKLLKLLAGKYKNICVVGDDDQSIYRWRGADIYNILNFEKDYEKCTTYRLEQNYRSTKNILAAANSVIANNLGRKAKELWTEKEEGEKVTVLSAESDYDECSAVMDRIEREFHKNNRNFKDFAILYRTNAQSRMLEDALRRNGISYIIVGGVRFYERKEVKDVLAYLRLLSNPDDSTSFTRIINYPARGIGEVTMGKLQNLAKTLGVSLFEAARRSDQAQSLSESMVMRLQRFAQLIEKYRDLKEQMAPAEIASALVDELGILRIFKEEGSIESLNRADNVRELLNAIMEFSRAHPDGNLDFFLEEVSLLTDIDAWNDRTNAVTLMTLHSAKGLEFPVVFITGLEEGLFPLRRCFDNIEELEEERRLFYVGSTRAQENLFLTWANRRRRMGETQLAMPSRFINELDGRYISHETVSFTNLTTRNTAHARKRSLGASAQRSTPAYEDISQEVPLLQVGARVQHPMFGVGTLKSLERSSRGTKATIHFDVEGEKKIILEYTTLEIVT